MHCIVHVQDRILHTLRYIALYYVEQLYMCSDGNSSIAAASATIKIECTFSIDKRHTSFLIHRSLRIETNVERPYSIQIHFQYTLAPHSIGEFTSIKFFPFYFLIQFYFRISRMAMKKIRVHFPYWCIDKGRRVSHEFAWNACNLGAKEMRRSVCTTRRNKQRNGRYKQNKNWENLMCRCSGVQPANGGQQNLNCSVCGPCTFGTSSSFWNCFSPVSGSCVCICYFCCHIILPLNTLLVKRREVDTRVV